MKTLHFACGATYQVENEPTRNKAGNLPRFLVRVSDKLDPKSPELHGKQMQCLYGCPAKVKDSHRKEQMAWTGDAAKEATGEPARCVLCRPVRVEEVAA